MNNIQSSDDYMESVAEELDSALEALQNEMRETISKLDPNEMVWIHQPPGMPPILCKEPVVGAVPVCATPPARRSLTDEEILNLWEDRKYHCEGEDFIKLVRWIERWYRQ